MHGWMFGRVFVGFEQSAARSRQLKERMGDPHVYCIHIMWSTRNQPATQRAERKKSKV